MAIKKFIIFITGVFFALLLSSCHSKYLSIKIEYSCKFAWKSDSSAFAFLAMPKIYRAPKGIAKFPDGGKGKKEYYDVALYYYDIKDKKITRAVDFNHFPKIHFKKLEFDCLNLAFSDSLIYYKISASDSAAFIRDVKNQIYSKEDSTKFIELMDYISKTHIYNINTKNQSIIDSIPLNVHWAENKGLGYSVRLQKKYFQKIKFSDWGLNIKEIYPQSKKTYMNYIIEKKGGTNVLEAIFQQIVPGFNEKDKNYILEKMTEKQQDIHEDFEKMDKVKDPYRKSLKKDEYERYIKYFNEIRIKLN